MDAAQRARLRALAEKARDALGPPVYGSTVLALLDALDAAERERDEARTQRDDTALEFDVVWGAALKANTERDALAALLRRARYFVEADVAMMDAISRHAPLPFEEQAKHDATEYPSEVLLREIDGALDGAKG